LEERRAVRRYKLALQVEIRLESEPISGMTRDISSHGFYFRIGQRLSAGKKFGFSIMPPWNSLKPPVHLSAGGPGLCAWKKFGTPPPINDL
jgi:hypothetical protein